MRRILSLFLLTLLGITAGFAATETFDFKFKTMGDEGWTSNYAEHTVKGTIANVVFASANKQTGTITDVPVTKGGNVTATLNNINSYKITGVKFVCKQWGSKAQTITLNVSGDGEAFTATQTTSDNFTLEATGLDTKAVRFTFSSTSNQVGISSLEITYETVPQGGDQPAEVATPAITVASSFEEGADESLSISCATEGATIYYSIAKGDESLVELEEYDDAVDLSQYEAGEYTVEAYAVNGDYESEVAEATFTVTEPVGDLTALKQVWDLADNAEFTFGAKTAVLGKDKNSRNLYIVDLDNAGGLMIDGGANNAWGDDYVFGKAIGSGWSGKKATYKNQPEATNTQNFAIDGTAEVQPLSIEATDVTADNYGRYAVIENATVAAGGTIEGYPLYNQLGIDMANVAAGTYNVYGIIGLYNQNLQFWPMRYEPIEDPTFVAAPTITVTPRFGVGADEAIFIDCATEGATIYYGIEKDGETLIELEEYTDPIDLSQYEAGEYTVEAYAVNGDYESEVAEATFTITEPAAPLTSLADVQALADNAVFTYGAKTMVLGKSTNGRNVYIVDLDNAAGLMVDGGSNNAWGDAYKFGAAISSDWSGKRATYNQQPEAVNTENFAIDGTVEVDPVEISSWSDVTSGVYGQYAVIKNATVAQGGTISGFTFYNQIMNYSSQAAGQYNVYGIIGRYRDNVQFWPIRYEAIVDPDAVATPVIAVTERFQVGADEAIFITCETEDAEITYSVDKGEENIDLGVYSGPIDLSSYEAGTYIVSAIASKDGHDSDEATATFTITEPAEAVEYQLVTSTNDLQGGDFVIFSSGHAAGLGANGDGINSGFTFNVNGDKVEVETEDILVLSIVPAEGKFAIMHGEKYMNLGSGAAPTFVNDSHAWPIEIDENGNATIHGATTNSNTPRALIYRSDSDIFKNYALSNVGNDYELVQIFKKGLTLAEVLELEEPANVNLTTDLGVKKRIGANAWAFDNNDNWIRLKFANEDAAEQAVGYANIHNLKGAYNGDYKDPEFTVTSFESSEESLETNIWEINLEQGFEDMPTPGQIVQVTGYYQSGGTLRGWSNLKGTSLTLANDFTDVHEFAMDDMENVHLGALYRNVEVAIQYKGDMPANGAPRRISPAEVDYDFQNLVGQLTENSMPVPSDMPTGVKTVEGAKEVKSVKYVNTVGQTSDRAFDGVNVMITTYTDGTTNTVKVVK